MKLIMPILTLLVGVGLGAAFFYAPETGRPVAAESATPTPHKSGRIVEADLQDVVETLRSRVRELEAELAQKGESLTEEVEIVEEPGGVWSQEKWWARERQQRQEWRDKDPEGYARIKAMHEKHMTQELTKMRASREFLEQVDTSILSPEARQVHEDFLRASAQREQLQVELSDFELDPKDRDKLHQEHWDLHVELGNLAKKERQALVHMAVENLRADGQSIDPVEAAKTMDRIYEVTGPQNGIFIQYEERTVDSITDGEATTMDIHIL